MGNKYTRKYPKHIAAARLCCDDDLEIDDSPAVSPPGEGGDPGVWVAAWIWVSDADAGEVEQ